MDKEDSNILVGILGAIIGAFVGAVALGPLKDTNYLGLVIVIVGALLLLVVFFIFYSKQQKAISALKAEIANFQNTEPDVLIVELFEKTTTIADKVDEPSEVYIRYLLRSTHEKDEHHKFRHTINSDDPNLVKESFKIKIAGEEIDKDEFDYKHTIETPTEDEGTPKAVHRYEFTFSISMGDVDSLKELEIEYLTTAYSKIYTTGGIEHSEFTIYYKTEKAVCNVILSDIAKMSKKLSLSTGRGNKLCVRDYSGNIKSIYMGQLESRDECPRLCSSDKKIKWMVLKPKIDCKFRVYFKLGNTTKKI